LQVTFVRNFGGYNEGESATFFKERAEALIKSGVAVEIKSPEVKKKSEKKEKPWVESPAESQF